MAQGHAAKWSFQQKVTPPARSSTAQRQERIAGWICSFPTELAPKRARREGRGRERAPAPAAPPEPAASIRRERCKTAKLWMRMEGRREGGRKAERGWLGENARFLQPSLGGGKSEADSERKGSGAEPAAHPARGSRLRSRSEFGCTRGRWGGGEGRAARPRH